MLHRDAGRLTVALRGLDRLVLGGERSDDVIDGELLREQGGEDARSPAADRRALRVGRQTERLLVRLDQLANGVDRVVLGGRRVLPRLGRLDLGEREPQDVARHRVAGLHRPSDLLLDVVDQHGRQHRKLGPRATLRRARWSRPLALTRRGGLPRRR